jgi:hypothetical protein
MILQHVLVLFLIVATPLWDWHEIPRLKASTDPRKKVTFYWKIVAASWVCAVVAVFTTGVAAVSTVQTVPGEISWLEAGSREGAIMKGITAGMLIAIMLPALLALRSEKIRAKAGKARQKAGVSAAFNPGRAGVVVGRMHDGGNLRRDRVSRIPAALLSHAAISFEFDVGIGGVVADFWDWTFVPGRWGRGADGSDWVRVWNDVCNDRKPCPPDRASCGDGFARVGNAAGGGRE